MTELTILMPCLNEAETLEVCIVKAFDYIERSGIRGEVLISDNGSTDGSQAIAELGSQRPKVSTLSWVIVTILTTFLGWSFS
jgi:glycosyltransferase involved in cell wall biosynthesis